MSTLTRDEILAMTAGEEMNRLVAQHVLGYCRAAFGRLSKRRAGTKLVPAECSYLIPPDSPALGTEKWAKPNSDLPLSDVPHVPSFSTDIAAAWEVVEEMRRRWRAADALSPLCWAFADFWGDGWGVCVLVDDENWAERVEAPTLPLGVCRCALLLTLTEAA